MFEAATAEEKTAVLAVCMTEVVPHLADLSHMLHPTQPMDSRLAALQKLRRAMAVLDVFQTPALRFEIREHLHTLFQSITQWSIMPSCVQNMQQTINPADNAEAQAKAEEILVRSEAERGGGVVFGVVEDFDTQGM